MGRVVENREHEWKCGRCSFIVPWQEEPPVVCPNCSYIHGQRDHMDVPDEVKLPIHR